MATKKKAARKKTAKKTAKKKAAKKKTTKKKAAKKVARATRMREATGSNVGSRYECGVCGLAVTVDQDCGCMESCDIVCCGEQMLPAW